ncbi:MAG TPA: glycosyltransferase [Alphaproteobacteria bacterium]|nr:glycosyltransferase [Alphaproteobacteria bacterium]
MPNPMPPKPVQRQQLRLVHVLASAEAGGAEQFFLRLMVALAQRPGDALVYPVVRQGSWISGELRRAGIRHETASFSRWLPWGTRAKVAKVARDWKAHAITAWMKRASHCTPRVNMATVGRLGGYYDLKYFKGRVKNLVCNTPDICHYARENGWPGDRVDYLPNFVPAPPPSWKNSRGDMRAFLKIPPNGIVLFMAARLHKVKGIDLAIEALERLDPRYHLVVVGSGPEEKALKAQAAQLKVADRVHWAGWQSNISGWASAADVWLVPSRDEPLGNVVLDAWAHGIPVIASRTKGPLHLIEHGVSGRLATTGSVADLANEIKEVTERRVLGMQIANGGTMAWRQKFTDGVVVDLWLEYYERLIRSEDNYE